MPKNQRSPVPRPKKARARKRIRQRRNPLHKNRKKRSPRRKNRRSEETDGGHDASKERCRAQSAESSSAGGGPGHALFAGDQGPAQRNAHGRGQAADSVRGGRMRGVRDRARHHHERKRKEFHR